MKPRPLLSTFASQPRLSGAFVILQCRPNIHIRAIAPTLSCYMWHDESRGLLQQEHQTKRWQSQGRRTASTSATAASKIGHSRAIAPPPLAKLAKTNVPAQTTYSSKLTPTAKRSSPSSTVPARSPTSSQATVPTAKAKEMLNPPTFTYAPEITVPARKADQNVVSWLWKAGRAYLTFYKTGISHVRQTSKLAKQLREKAQQQGAGRDIVDVLTRAEWQIVRRSRKDVLRLPAMGVLILLLGEWLPLVVLYITPLIPEACRIPQQVKRDLTKRENRRADRLRRVSLDAIRLQMRDKRPVGSGMDIDMETFERDAKVMPVGQTPKDMKTQDMTLFELMLFSATHDCHSRIWDWLHVTPPKFLLQRNVRQKLEYLVKDDSLIERDGGFAALSKDEVERACVERGISVLGKREDELRKALVVQWRGGKP